MSSTKSIAGLLTGMLIADGKLALEDPVGNYLPEWREGRRGEVTVKHLLTMTSGLERRTKEQGSVGFVSDKNAFVRKLTPTKAPGSLWSYSNEGAQLLSPILDAAAGEPIQKYAKRRLFQPLGMRETQLHLDPAKHAWTYADMETTPRDMARIGQLMLERGRWHEEQIVSDSWVSESTAPQQAHKRDYGYLWWLHPELGGYAALGYLSTDIHVFPKQQLVIVRTQSKPVDGAPQNYRDQLLKLVPEMAAKMRK